MSNKNQSSNESRAWVTIILCLLCRRLWGLWGLWAWLAGWFLHARLLVNLCFDLVFFLAFLFAVYLYFFVPFLVATKYCPTAVLRLQ